MLIYDLMGALIILIPSYFRHPGIVVADSAVTSDVKAIAVYGKYVIWSSLKVRKIFIGELDEDMYFIPMRNIQAIDGTDKDPVHTHHVVLF